MLRRSLAVARRFPRATLLALAILAAAGAAAGILVPVDGRLDRITPSGSAVERAGKLERKSFGGDAATVLITGDMVKTLRNPADLVRLVGLEGCLAGVVAEDVKKGPCAKIRDLDAVQSVQGPATYVQSAISAVASGAGAKYQAILKEGQQANQLAQQAALKKGFSKAEAKAQGDAADSALRLQAIDSLAQLIRTTGIGLDENALTLRDKNFITRVLFAKGADGKLGPKRRLAWLIPTRNTAVIQVSLVGDLSAGRRAKVTKALQAAMREPAFALKDTRATLTFSGLAPATQSLSDTIRRSALALGLAALLVMGLVLLVARRLRRRLLPVLVAAATVGLALLLLGIPTGSLSLAVVVALPVLVGLAVDQAVQAQLRLERRLHPAALRSLVIAGSAASASALALAASPFAVVRTVAVAVAVAILLAIVLAAMASAAALELAGREPTKPSSTGLKGALADADAALAGSAPTAAAGRLAVRVTDAVAKISRPVAIAAVAIGLLMAVAGAGVGGSTRVQTDLAALVPPNASGAKELRELQNKLGFASSVSLVVHTRNVASPDLWRSLVAAQQAVTKGTDGRCPGNGLCTPLPLDELLTGKAGGALPTDAQIQTALTALPEQLQRAIVDPDQGTIALPFGVGTLDGARQRQLVGLLNTIARGLQRTVPGVESVEVSGLPAVVDASAAALESTGTRALLAALALLLPALVLLATLRAPRRVIVALVPPALALGWSELALWGLGVPRTPLTAALGVLVAAVAVEFSVLLGERFAALRRVGVPRERAVSATLRETGGAVAISAGATIAGFAVLGFASIPLIADFGIATAIDLLLVLLALVIVAPATWILADRASDSSTTLLGDERSTLG